VVNGKAGDFLHIGVPHSGLYGLIIAVFCGFVKEKWAGNGNSCKSTGTTDGRIYSKTALLLSGGFVVKYNQSKRFELTFNQGELQ